MAAKNKRSGKKPIEQYDHKGKKRVNNPPVGLVTPDTDRESGKKTYAYDPHIDPSQNPGSELFRSSSITQSRDAVQLSSVYRGRRCVG